MIALRIDVRARRPQAGAEDPELVHDEYAVAVGDDGRLVTWRFRPLPVREHPGRDEIEIPGRPRYAASPVDDVPFDGRDTVRASDQLVLAQDRAAEREADAVAIVRAALAAEAAHAELVAETLGTAAALRRTTGQR